MRKQALIVLILAILPLAAAGQAKPESEPSEGRYLIETRLLRGSSPKSPLPAAPAVRVTAFSDLYVAAQGPEKEDKPGQDPLASLKAELKEIYNLSSVDQVSLGRLLWDGRRAQVSQSVLLDGRIYPILFSPKVTGPQTMSLRVEFSREAGEAKPESLMSTDVQVRLGERMVVGFPVGGETLHLSLLVRKLTGGETAHLPIHIWKPSSLNTVPVRTILPVPVSAPMPEYPEALKKRKIEGVAVLHVETGLNGRVKSMVAMGATNAELAAAAMKAVGKWIFRPAAWNQRPVSSEFYLRIEFRLPE